MISQPATLAQTSFSTCFWAKKVVGIRVWNVLGVESTPMFHCVSSLFKVCGEA